LNIFKISAHYNSAVLQQLAAQEKPCKVTAMSFLPLDESFYQI